MTQIAETLVQSRSEPLTLRMAAIAAVVAIGLVVQVAWVAFLGYGAYRLIVGMLQPLVG